jgi:hypothetical protein
MKNETRDELFIKTVARVNRYLVVLGIFFLGYFLLKKKVDTFLFLLALSNMAFAMLSCKHLEVTNRLAVELSRAKNALEGIAKESGKMHE